MTGQNVTEKKNIVWYPSYYGETMAQLLARDYFFTRQGILISLLVLSRLYVCTVNLLKSNHQIRDNLTDTLIIGLQKLALRVQSNFFNRMERDVYKYSLQQSERKN